MLSNEYFLANFRFCRAENEPAKNSQNFANFLNFAREVPYSQPQSPYAPAPGAADQLPYLASPAQPGTLPGTPAQPEGVPKTLAFVLFGQELLFALYLP